VPEPEVTPEPELNTKPVYEKDEWNQDKSQIPNKINGDSKTWFGSKNEFYWIGGSCLVLTILFVVMVAVVSNTIDKKRKKKEIDEQMSISQNNLEKYFEFLEF
jgi:hypothetical protein